MTDDTDDEPPGSAAGARAHPGGMDLVRRTLEEARGVRPAVKERTSVTVARRPPKRIPNRGGGRKRWSGGPARTPGIRRPSER